MVNSEPESAMEATPFLDGYLRSRRLACKTKLKNVGSFLEGLAMLQDCLEAAPVLQFEEVLVEPLALRTHYCFAISVPILRGNADLLTFPLDPTTYKYSGAPDLKEGLCRRERDYIIAVFEAPNVRSHPNGSEKQSLTALALETLKAHVGWVEKEVGEHNGKVRLFIKYRSDWILI
jgi:hypothetical protein